MKRRQMRRNLAITILTLTAVAIGLCTLVGCGSGEQTKLVHAWQLTTNDRYDSEPMRDPVVSWSPDSRSLVFTLVDGKTYKKNAMRWNVGEKTLTRVADGVSPNYVDNNTILLFQANPISILEKDLKTGKVHSIAPQLHQLDLWKDITSFSYNPARKSLELRFSDFTRYYESGCQEVDLSGKFVRNIPRATGGGVLDRSMDPKGGRSAVILGDLTGSVSELRISKSGEDTKGISVATGQLGAVAWSPDGRFVAYSEDNTVNVCSPSGDNKILVARFGKLPDSGDQPRVCRLVWSPDGNYLAAVELVPKDVWTFEMIYVLDMSKVGR